MKRVLNVGGGSKLIPIAEQFADYEHVLLDIDPDCQPDICLDARELSTLPAGQFDAVYCSHNLEHFHEHEVQVVLAGFLHVLNDRGFALIKVPDIGALIQHVVERNLGLEDVVYHTMNGAPIRTLDMLYGWKKMIERNKSDFYMHKTGFSETSLGSAAMRAGFKVLYSTSLYLEIVLYAFKREPDETTKQLFKLED